ncbi:MAG: hypothetical protein [Microviridae sp.]|nr:MAG: hypothetical protein [Microviridae sp.]
MAKKQIESPSLDPCMTYGIDHSKFYNPSIVSNFLSEFDEKGNFIKRHSDVHLLLRQQNLHKSIGVESLRRYFEQQNMAGNQTALFSTDNLSDDELFDLIEPKSINNLTSAYEFGRYLEAHDKELKQKVKDLRETRDRRTKFERMFGLNKDKETYKTD